MINTYGEQLDALNKNTPTVRSNRSEKACKYIWEFNRLEKKLLSEPGRHIKKFRSNSKRVHVNLQNLRQAFLLTRREFEEKLKIGDI